MSPDSFVTYVPDRSGPTPPYPQVTPPHSAAARCALCPGGERHALEHSAQTVRYRGAHRGGNPGHSRRRRATRGVTTSPPDSTRTASGWDRVPADRRETRLPIERAL